jgi:hypothetical protein
MLVVVENEKKRLYKPPKFVLDENKKTGEKKRPKISGPKDLTHEVHIQVDLNSDTGFSVSFLLSLGFTKRMGEFIKIFWNNKGRSFK